MSIIATALRMVKERINHKILKLAFMVEANTYKLNTSLDKQIEDLVIVPTVLADCNLINGISVNIDLLSCYIDTYVSTDGIETTIITIPPSVINNKKITSISSITQNITSVDTSHDRNNLIDVTSRLLPSSNAELDIITNIRLLSNNVLIISEPMDIYTPGTIELEIENDEMLENIPRGGYRSFGKMTIKAVEHYIYNKLSLDLEEGSLYYGHDISAYSNIISKYESSIDEYDEMLDNVWPKVSFASDPNKMNDFIDSLVGKPL